MELDLTPTPDFPVRRAGVVAVPLRGARWRVTRPRGDVIGYIDRLGDGVDARWRSSRMRGRRDGFVALGDYPTAADALAVLGA